MLDSARHNPPHIRGGLLFKGRVWPLFPAPWRLLLLLCLLSPAGWCGVQTSSPVKRPKDPPALDQVLASLRNAPDAASAALKARDILDRGPAGRAALLSLLQDPSLALQGLQGVLGVFDARNDRAPDFLTAFYKGLCHSEKGPRRQIFRRVLKSLDRKGTLLAPLLQELARQKKPGSSLLKGLLVVVDGPVKRRDAIRALVARLLKEPDQAVRQSLEGALRDLSLQFNVQGPAAWKAFESAFLQQHPKGFELGDLVRESLARQRRQLQSASKEEFLRKNLVLEAQKSLRELAAFGDVPSRFFDARLYPQSIRSLAASLVATASAKAPRPILERMVADLLKGLAESPQGPVTLAALDSLVRVTGSLKPGDPLDGQIVKALAPLLNPTRPLPVLTRATRVAGQTHDPAQVERLVSLYLAVLKKPGEAFAALRQGVIEAVCQYHQKDGALVREDLVVKALWDPSSKVQSSALRCLGTRKTLAHATSVARALEKVKDPSMRLSFLITLKNIGQYQHADVVAALLTASKDEGEVQHQAVVELLIALARYGLKLPQAPAVQARLIGLFPGELKDKSRRAEIVKDLAGQKSKNLVPVTAAWCLQAQTSSARQSLARLLGETAPKDVDLLLRTGETLLAGGDPAVAELLLRRAEKLAADQGAGPEPKARRRKVRLLLARALRLAGGAKRLEEARGFLSKALQEAADDAELLQERGEVLELLGKEASAIADLTRVLSLTAGKGSQGERLKLLLKVAGLNFRAHHLAVSQKLLESLPREVWTRDVHLLSARLQLALDHPTRAYQEARAAQEKKGQASEEAVLLLLAQSGARSADPAARESVAGLLKKMPKGFPALERQAIAKLQALDGKARQLVAALDAAPAAKAQAATVAVAALKEAAGPWLVQGLPQLAAKGPQGAPALWRRVGLLKTLFGKSLKAGKILDPPPLPLKPKALENRAEAIVTWWLRAHAH